MRRGKRGNEFPDNGFEIWGGYMNAKISKLEEQFLEQAAKEQKKISGIFDGISIFVNGYTKPSANELKVLMAEHGGIYHHYFKSDCTKFIIASNLPDTKVKNLPTTKIAKPEWISDSIKAGTLLDYKDYLLYSNLSKTQPRLHFRNIHANSISDETIKLTNDRRDRKETPCDTTCANIQPKEQQQTFNNITTKTETRLDNLPQINVEITTNKLKEKKSPDVGKCSSTAVDPKFLSEFYNNSRLHHISQLGAGFKQYVNELRNASDHSFPLRESLKKDSTQANNISINDELFDSKTIMHIDMDCFFVSVGLRKHPHLRGHPVAVTHSKGGVSKHKREGVDREAEFNLYKEKRKNKLTKSHGKQILGQSDTEEKEVPSRFDWMTEENDKYGSMSEIASCSYEARALGLHNGMFMGPALRLCPDLKTIPYDFEAYKEVAYILYNTIAQYTLDIEAVSCDEMYVDCTELLKEVQLTPLEFAKIIREEIKLKTGCPCSTGFGSNRLQARLATKTAKPDGQFYLSEEKVQSYFADVSLGDLPGIGHQMENRLSALGYTNCASLRVAPLPTLQKHFGNKTGLLLYNYCRGIDNRPLNFTTIRKSISAGVNYGIRFEDNNQCELFLRQLCQEVCSRMTQNNIIGKTITFKLMVRAADAPVETAKFMGHGFCDNITKSSNLSHPTDNLHIITKEVLDIYQKLNIKPEEMRGISIQISKLENLKEVSEKKKGGIQNFLKPKIMTRAHENNTDVDLKESVKESCESEIIQETPSTVKLKSDVSPRPIVDQQINHTVETQIQNQNNNSLNKRQQSPVKRNKSLGLTGKRRGRPPKHLALSNNAKKEKNLSLNTFLKSSSNTFSMNNLYNLEDLDQEFLDALPEDIRSEILANYKIKSHNLPQKNNKKECKSKTSVVSTSHKSESLEIDPDYLAALPEELRKEVETNIASYKKYSFNTTNKNTPKSNVEKVNQEIPEEEKHHEIIEITEENCNPQDEILNLHWKDMRSMLKDWFRSSEDPMECDVDMIISYVQNLVMTRKLEDLYFLLNFFYRIMTDVKFNNCNWHQAYLKTESGVQESMLLIYKRKLKTSTLFVCCNP